jgi:membrane-associated phospholipid phosphatase
MPCACVLISKKIRRMELLDILSFSVLFLYLVPVVLFFYTRQVKQLSILLGLIGTTFLSETLKHHVFHESSPRPKGAKNCNIWCDDGNQEGKPGMPSSHSAEVAFFSSVYYSQTTNPLIRVLLIVYAAAVMLSRYLKRCHTIQQIGAGAILGLTLSWCFIRSCVN